MCHSTVAVSFTLVCNASLYSGRAFNSAMQCVTLMAVGFMRHATVAVGFLSVMQRVALQWQ